MAGFCGAAIDMLLYCIRHGQTVYNAQGRIQGQTDVVLSELGVAQGEAVADALADKPITAVYSSPLRRALQTAEPLADRLGLTVQTDPRLMEMNLGDFQGQLRAELDREYPEAFTRWRSGDPDFAFPGGESRRSLTTRALAAFDTIRRTEHSHVAVVTHGALLLAVIRAMLHIASEIRMPPLENASISVLSSEGSEVKVVRFNVVEHLRDIGLSGVGDL
jgi:broad specificity phosphatase PhoE